MALCHCCGRNEATVDTEWETRVIPTNQGNIRKRVAVTSLCDTCNDGQYPNYEKTPDGGSILKCPQKV